MHEQSTASATPTLRDLIRAAHAAGWTHYVDGYSNGRGGRVHPLEHVWYRGDDRVSYEGGELSYRNARRERLWARVDSVEQAVALLAAYGLSAVTR